MVKKFCIDINFINIIIKKLRSLPLMRLLIVEDYAPTADTVLGLPPRYLGGF